MPYAQYFSRFFVIRALASTTLLGLCACGSQIDDIATPVVRSTSVSPGGIYQGQLTSQSSGTASPVVALFDDQTHFVIYATDGSYLISGLYNTVNTSVSGQARYFVLNSDATSPQTLDLFATYDMRSEIAGTYTRQDGDAGSTNLLYQPLAYETRSATALLQGTWITEDAYGAITTSFTIDGNGGVSGQIPSTTPADSCNYTGQISVIDEQFNLYRITLSESCGAETQALSGLTTLLPASADGTTPPQLVLALSSATVGRLFRLTNSQN